MEDNKLGKNTEKQGVCGAASTEDNGKESGILGVKQPILRSLAEITALLDKLPPNTKVKVKILDFESFRQFLPLVNKYNNKFYLFKYETDFEIIQEKTLTNIKNEMTNFKESFTNWLKNQKIDPIIKEILQKEIE